MPYSPNRPLEYRPRPVKHSAVSEMGDMFRWRAKSLVRGTVLVLASTWASFHLAHFPHNHFTLWLLVPLVLSLAGTADTLRCMQPRWNWYHGGVLLCVYMDLMAVCIILFFLLYPLSL